MTVISRAEQTRLEIEAGRRTLCKHQRVVALATWIAQKKVKEIDWATTMVGDEVFVDDHAAPQDSPSEQFFARVALAVKAQGND